MRWSSIRIFGITETKNEDTALIINKAGGRLKLTKSELDGPNALIDKGRWKREMRLFQSNTYNGNCYNVDIQVRKKIGLYWPPCTIDQIVFARAAGRIRITLPLSRWKRYIEKGSERAVSSDPPTERSDKSDQKVDNIVAVYNGPGTDLTRRCVRSGSRF
ncbi:hypothetical protein Trydic_g9101 [Trypoxylus dichotomus]